MARDLQAGAPVPHTVAESSPRAIRGKCRRRPGIFTLLASEACGAAECPPPPPSASLVSTAGWGWLGPSRSEGGHRRQMTFGSLFEHCWKPRRDGLCQLLFSNYGRHWLVSMRRSHDTQASGHCCGIAALDAAIDTPSTLGRTTRARNSRVAGRPHGQDARAG